MAMVTELVLSGSVEKSRLNWVSSSLSQARKDGWPEEILRWRLVDRSRLCDLVGLLERPRLAEHLLGRCGLERSFMTSITSSPTTRRTIEGERPRLRFEDLRIYLSSGPLNDHDLPISLDGAAFRPGGCRPHTSKRVRGKAKWFSLRIIALGHDFTASLASILLVFWGNNVDSSR